MRGGSGYRASRWRAIRLESATTSDPWRSTGAWPSGFRRRSSRSRPSVTGTRRNGTPFSWRQMRALRQKGESLASYSSSSSSIRARGWDSLLATEGTAELPGEELDRAAGSSGLLLSPFALGLEAAVPDEGGPGLDRATDRVGVEGIVVTGPDRLQHVGDDAQERAQGHGGLDAVLPAHPGAREDARDLLEVVEEEPLRRLAEAVRLPAAEGVEVGEDPLQLL